VRRPRAGAAGAFQLARRVDFFDAHQRGAIALFAGRGGVRALQRAQERAARPGMQGPALRRRRQVELLDVAFLAQAQRAQVHRVRRHHGDDVVDARRPACGDVPSRTRQHRLAVGLQPVVAVHLVGKQQPEVRGIGARQVHVQIA
jgi:hypothetical protein